MHIDGIVKFPASNFQGEPIFIDQENGPRVFFQVYFSDVTFDPQVTGHVSVTCGTVGIQKYTLMPRPIWHKALGFFFKDFRTEYYWSREFTISVHQDLHWTLTRIELVTSSEGKLGRGLSHRLIEAGLKKKRSLNFDFLRSALDKSLDEVYAKRKEYQFHLCTELGYRAA